MKKNRSFKGLLTIFTTIMLIVGLVLGGIVVIGGLCLGFYKLFEWFDSFLPAAVALILVFFILIVLGAVVFWLLHGDEFDD